jgi:hypothetical protein
MSAWMMGTKKTTSGALDKAQMFRGRVLARPTQFTTARTICILNSSIEHIQYILIYIWARVKSGYMNNVIAIDMSVD